jgi:SpoVK/Ycf46/Vps4 family AAA+-type ATPase
MSKRTEVKSANDRYANLETNYLLQRLESYKGIVIVTTNAGTRIDHAFQRRFDMVVGFHPPDPFERVLIWQRHLPPLHRVSDSCIQQISHQCAMTGGQIRNAALYAALLAVDADRDGEVNDYDLERAVQAEYRKAGGTCPVHATSEVRGQSTALSQFLGEVS